MLAGVHVFLAATWYLLLGTILMLYVITDGFDLGVGILSLFERQESQGSEMMATLSGVWDANETWLVLFGGALFGAFPAAYALALYALYIPISAMLFGLILRGVAFKWRAHARSQRIWNLAFGIGSLLAALAQGYGLGGLIGGLPVADGQFTGNAWSWLSPFSSVVAVGVAAGYALLGGTYLIIKTDGDVQAISRKRSTWAAWVTLSAAAVATIATPALHPYIARRWFTVPGEWYLVPLSVVTLGAFATLRQALRSGCETSPFFWSRVIFMTSFVGLAASLYPYLVPPVMTFADTASSSATLVFMLLGIGVLIPVMLVYNGYQYVRRKGRA
jgi:cytochrome d ubiquinol oxidase subunit II